MWKLRRKCSAAGLRSISTEYIVCIPLDILVGDTNPALQELIRFVRLNCHNPISIQLEFQEGGDVLQESISSNVSEDTVTLEFQRSDGTLITQLVDFRNDVQILKALVLGEEERGQSQYQVMCFVCHFRKGDFISSDAMSKLRQKNPGTIRTPEEDRGRENHTMEFLVDVPRSGVISRHIASLCGEAGDATYTRDHDIKLWASQPGASLSALLSAVTRVPPAATPRCLETADLWTPCVCHLETCIGWYPCGLKYCKGKGDAKGKAEYRCGIKTCKKCSLFAYYVRQKQLCLWDE